MAKDINVTKNVIHTNSAGEVIGSEDAIYVDFGVKVEGLSDGSLGDFSGIESTDTSGFNVDATIEGVVVGSGDGILIDNAGGSRITVGASGSVVSLGAGYEGIKLYGNSNTVTNDGQITGMNGVVINFDGTGNNNIVNNGLISATNGDAIFLAGADNIVQNNGVLSANDGGAGISISENVSGESSNSITNTGKIIGGAGIVLRSTFSQPDSGDFIDNSGTIVATATAVEVANSHATVANSGSISGSDGIDLGAEDTLNNSGVIQALVGVGVTQFASSIHNSGTIAGATAAIGGDTLLLGEDIRNSNSGIISSSTTAIDFDGEKIRIANDGEISGKDGAILLGESDSGIGFDTIINTGKISSSTGNAVDIEGGNNQVENAGKISAEIGGISLYSLDESHGHNVVTNSGTVTAGNGALFIAGLAGDVDAVHNSGTLQGSLLQSGTGILETGFGSLNIANSGVIDGYDAVVFDSSAADKIDNSGTIIGDGIAIEELGTGTTTVVNTGHIAGGILFGAGSGTYDGVLGTVDGVVGGGAASDTIKGGADGETLSGNAGNDLIKGGAGDDVIAGGAGADKLAGGGGNNTFVYAAVAESYGGPATHDTIAGFDALTDRFDFEVAITGVDKAIKVGTLDKNAFDADMQAMLPETALRAHHTVLVTPNAGDLAGHIYLIVDDNGVAGFQAKGDYVIELSLGAHLASLSVSNFG